MNKKIANLKLQRKIAIALVVVVVIGGYYYQKSASKASDSTSYVFGKVEKGSILTSVSGSGQISSSNQIDIKSKVSGDILNVLVKNGQEVKSGDILAQVDSVDAQRTVRDAKTSLDNAKLSLDKLNEPADEYSVWQAENSLKSAIDNLEKLKLTQESNYQKSLESKQKAEDNINKAYEDALNTVDSVFLNLPTIVTKIDNVLYSYEIGSTEISVGPTENNSTALINSVDAADRSKLENFQTTAQDNYKTARTSYDLNLSHYKSITHYSDKAAIESLLDKTLRTTKAVSQAIKSENNYLDAWIDLRSEKDLSIFSKVNEYKTNLSTYTGQTNGYVSSLLSVQRTLQDNRDSIASIERDLEEMDRNNPIELASAQTSIKDKEYSLEKLKSGPEALDIKSQEFSIKQKQDALSDAVKKLEDYTIRAPFDGVITTIDLKKGDQLSSNAAVTTIITKQNLAEITLNEVDVAKVKVGQKVNLTFTAIEDLNITGEVAEIDSIGTVSQGVVNYAVKIAFDTQDERIKPQMSVTATITTDQKFDILVVPNSAVKTENEKNYIEIINSENQNSQTPEKKYIEVGLSNDTNTEILSGLNEGDQIIIRTVNNSTTSTTQNTSQQRSGLQMFGGGASRMGR